MIYRLITWQSVGFGALPPVINNWLYLFDRFLIFLMSPGVRQYGIEFGIKGSRFTRICFIGSLWAFDHGGPLERTKIAFKFGRLVIQYGKVNDEYINRCFRTTTITKYREMTWRNVIWTPKTERSKA